jgi:hypothetical protein
MMHLQESHNGLQARNALLGLVRLAALESAGFEGAQMTSEDVHRLLAITSLGRSRIASQLDTTAWCIDGLDPRKPRLNFFFHSNTFANVDF